MLEGETRAMYAAYMKASRFAWCWGLFLAGVAVLVVWWWATGGAR